MIFGFGRKKQIEQEEQRTLALLRELMDLGDEDKYVEALKRFFPEITPEELVRDVESFRKYRLEHLRAAGRIR
jgi:hypothetical protein